MSKSVTGTLKLKIKFSDVPNEMAAEDMAKFIQEMDYNFTAKMGEATVTDTEVIEFNVTSVRDELTIESEPEPPFKLTATPAFHWHLNSQNNSVDFSCRIWLDPEEIQVNVWVHELEVEDRDSVGWVLEEFGYLSLEELYDLFKLPYNKDEPYNSGKYQIIATGTVRGWKDQDTPDGPGEYNSEMEINSSASKVWVPDPVVEDDQSNTVEQ